MYLKRLFKVLGHESNTVDLAEIMKISLDRLSKMPMYRKYRKSIYDLLKQVFTSSCDEITPFGDSNYCIIISLRRYFRQYRRNSTND